MPLALLNFSSQCLVAPVVRPRGSDSRRTDDWQCCRVLLLDNRVRTVVQQLGRIPVSHDPVEIFEMLKSLEECVTVTGKSEASLYDATVCVNPASFGLVSLQLLRL